MAKYTDRRRFTMDENNRYEEMSTTTPGDKVLRLRRRKRGKLRIVPNIYGVWRFVGEVVTRTPLVPLIVVLIGLWFLSSWGIYLVEHEENIQLRTFSHCLWWSFTAMQTQGANAPGPITDAGLLIGGIWSVFSTVAFFGVIIGTLYSYYMLPHRRPYRELISTIQYNLEEMENLSAVELETLRETVESLINNQLRRQREDS